eukprot:6189453-Pleurochrysis_carterae.AAC.2
MQTCVIRCRDQNSPDTPKVLKLLWPSLDGAVGVECKFDFVGRQAGKCKMGFPGLKQEQVVAIPCNSVRMLQVGVRRDEARLSRVRVQEEEFCQPVVWMTNAAITPFRLVLPKDGVFRLNLHVERQEMTNKKQQADRHWSNHEWENQYRARLQSWRYESRRVSAVRASRLRIRERMN